MPATIVMDQSRCAWSGAVTPQGEISGPVANQVPWRKEASLSQTVVGIENIATPTPNQPICVTARTVEGMSEPKVPKE